ncbi:Pectinesterase inhibitor domain [Dillenia turbinata]|uniref:Pectinesterase inhibitor domain n=1 Tax=Dillenia turbinata TaxID=194707 RepID=A0AAN8V7E0_9MAGN
MASLNPYGKFNEVDQERLLARPKTKKRIAIIALSSIVLAAIVVGAVLGTSHGNNKSSKNGDVQSISTSVKAVCDGTLYPSTCYTTLAPLVQNLTQVNPEQLFKLSVQLAINELLRASQKFSQNEGVFGNVTDPIYVAALENCRVLFDLALDHLNNSLSSTVSLVNAIDDFTTWLSTAGTCQQTCIDGFQNAPLQTSVESSLRNSTELTSIGLAIIRPGASTKIRVKWKGLKLNLGNKDASKFTVKQFINGNKWIPSNVPYNPSL